MPVDRAQVERIAKLARLALSPEEISRFEQDLTSILSYVDQIQTADVDGVSDEVDPSHMDNVLRDDTIRPGLSREVALQNAPDTDGTYFRVPPVLPTAEH